MKQAENRKARDEETADLVRAPSERGKLEILDVQVHLFRQHDERYPWDPAVLGDPKLANMRSRYRAHFAGGTPEAMLTAMDGQDVHGALVVTPSIYGYDNAYSVDAYKRHPDRFRVVGRVNSARRDVEDVVQALSEDSAYAGLRLNLWAQADIARFLAGGDDRMLAAAQRFGLVVCANAPGRFDLHRRIAVMYPELRLVVDHLGLFEIAMLDPGYGDTFAGLPGLLELAEHEQVTVKLTSLPLLSREPYPHADVWPHLRRVIAAFGPGRLMWGSDQTVFDHDYGETVDVIRETGELGDEDKALILGATLRRVWDWPASDPIAN